MEKNTEHKLIFGKYRSKQDKVIEHTIQFVGLQS